MVPPGLLSPNLGGDLIFNELSQEVAAPLIFQALTTQASFFHALSIKKGERLMNGGREPVDDHI